MRAAARERAWDTIKEALAQAGYNDHGIEATIDAALGDDGAARLAALEAVAQAARALEQDMDMPKENYSVLERNRLYALRAALQRLEAGE